MAEALGFFFILPINQILIYIKGVSITAINVLTIHCPKISGAIGDIDTAMSSAVAVVSAKGQLCRDVILPGPHSDIKGFVCGD